jgi:hypothetical protein
MNPIGNNILPAYLGNHGLSYASNNNIPNPWTMIFNLYYQETLHLFSPTHLNLWPFPNPFPNMVSIEIATTIGS